MARRDCYVIYAPVTPKLPDAPNTAVSRQNYGAKRGFRGNQERNFGDSRDRGHRLAVRLRNTYYV